MNTQKRAKPKRLLSLLLALIMLVGVLPLSAVSVGAETEEHSGATAMLAATNGLNEDLPTWNTSPTWELIKDVFVQETRIRLLREWLGSNTSSDEERYIRLEDDIDISAAYLKDNEKIAVNGKKVLDLNGHTISIKLGKGAGYSGRQTAITVNKDATLMVIDSKGGGKIFGDSWICAPEDLGYSRASTDLFYNNGTLIINMPNGEIETGRSKKQWVTAASENGVKESIAYARYSGYIRGQSNGSAIIGSEDSTTVIVSGRVIGRGFYKFGESPWGTSTDTPYQRCTAVRTDGTFIMYGGEIYGMGGANVLSTSYKSDVMIYSGYFRTKTIDRMAIQADKQEDLTSAHANFTKKCEYGSIGVKGIASDAEYFNGKHDATVRPKSVTDMTSDSIVITQNYGANIIDPRTMDHWYVYADYTPYYPLAARNYVGNGGYTSDPYGYDYKLSTNWKARAEFTVLDSKGNVVGYGDERNWVRDEPNRSVFRCDVLACKEKDGSAISWISAETYTLRCKITESWGGDPEQKRTVYQDLMFSIWNEDVLQAAKSMAFEFTPTTTAEGDPTSFLVTLKESCFDAAKANFFTTMDIRYSYYEPITNNKGEVTGYEKKTETAVTYADIIRKSGLYGDNTWYLGKETVLKPKAAGPLEVFIDIYDSNGCFVDTKTYKIFAMPALTGRFLGGEEYTVPENGTMKAQYSSWDARMNAGMADFAAMTDYSVSTSSIIWQYCALGGDQFEDIRSGDAGFSFEENKNILVSNRTGYYRASYQFQGARYYSPRTILLLAMDYDSNYQPYITSQGSGYEEFGENAIIEVNLNADANWKNVKDYTLFCRSYPAGARMKNTQVTKTTNQFTLEGDFLYSNVTKETFVPGSYTFEAKVRHANGTATSVRFRITYGITSTGFIFSVNNEKAERLSTGDGMYRTLSAEDDTFKVGYSLYPANSVWEQYKTSEYSYTLVNLTNDIVSLADDGTATVLAPGDARLQLRIVKKSTGETVASPTLTVTIPVVGFEVEEPNYNDYLGDYWSKVKATVKSVWGPGGRKITTGADQYVAVSLRDTQGTGIGGTVDYDDFGGIVWNVQTKAGYQFPMEVIGTYYKDNGDVKITCRADVTKIQTNAFTDTVKTAREHGSYGTANAGEYYVYTVGGTDGDPTSAIFTMKSKNAHVKDPNKKYIDVISISTGTPAVGDPRYEGTDSTKYYDEYMTVDLGSLSGLLRADKTQLVTAKTWVSKLNSITGSGKPYDNALSENKTEYWDVWNYSGSTVPPTPKQPTKKYEVGTYVNQLRLEIWGADENGDRYRFAPEVKLFVNGHLIEFANTTYSTSDYCFLTADYYFDVGDVTQYNSATVDATDITPTVGTKPKGIDSVSVVETDDIEVSKLLWFVDANGNGKYDFGEEASEENGNLNSDGTFMANKKYSVALEVAVADGAAGRLAYPFSLKLKYDFSLGSVRSSSEKLISSLDPSGVFTFPYNYITQVDETVTAPADGKYTKNTQLIYQSDAAAAAKGYRLSPTFAYKNVDGSEVSETGLIPGKQYRYDATFTHGTDESWFAPPLLNVKLDGVTLSNVASTTESWYEAYSNTMTIHYLFTAPSPGYTVYGAATSFGSQTDDVTIQLIESGASEAAYEVIVQGNSIGYAIENVVPGTYTMKVMKKNHVTREYSITVGTENLKQDVKIHLKGDINGDGKITMVDSAKANSHARGVALLTDYELKCADVVANDGNVTMADAGRINAHAKGMSKLW